MRRASTLATASRALGALVALVALLAPAEASADERAECGASYERAQRAHLAGRYVQARAELLVCVRDVCPEFVRAGCVTWLDQVDAEQPTVVFVAVGVDGRDLRNPPIGIDGVVHGDVADGMAHALDPGPHAITMVALGQKVTQDIVVRRGEKARRVVLRLAGPVAAPPPRDLRPPPTSAVVAGGASLLLLAVGTTFWGLGTAGAGRYNDGCAQVGGSCSTGERDTVRRELVTGDILVALGIATAATAAYLYFARSPAARGSVVTSPALMRF